MDEHANQGKAIKRAKGMKKKIRNDDQQRTMVAVVAGAVCRARMRHPPGPGPLSAVGAILNPISSPSPIPSPIPTSAPTPVNVGPRPYAICIVVIAFSYIPALSLIVLRLLTLLLLRVAGTCRL